jgi:glycine/D-amino acid oxidase-like deaminating enzyme
LLPHLAEVMWSVGQPVLHFRPADPEAYRPPRFVPWAADIGHTGWYGFAALADGTLKIANHGPGRRIHPDDPREVAPDEEARFRVFLRESLPGLADAPVIGRRLCPYCDTWDGNFWIDRDPDRPGLVVASGGSGHAFKFGPMLGPLIADVVEGKPNRYAARFAWRTRADLSKEDARHM